MKMLSMNRRWAVLFTIFLTAVLLRVGGNIAREKLFFHKPFLLSGNEYFKDFGCDSMWYDGTAKALLKGKGISSISLNWYNEKNLGDEYVWIDHKRIDDTYYAHKAISPFYPIFLALCYYLWRASTLAYFIPHVIIGSLTCVFIYLLAEEVFNDTRIALTSALAVAFYPDLVFWTYQVRTETLFIFFLSLGFWFLIRGNARQNTIFVLTSAVVFGLACLTRETLIPFIPLLFLWQVFSGGKPAKERVKTGLSLMLIILAVLAPWCGRNLLVFGKFTPFGDEVYAFLFHEGPDKVQEANYLCRSNKFLISRIFAFIANDPKAYALAFLERFITFWSPYTALMKGLAKLYKGLTWLILFPLGFFGMAFLRKNWSRAGLLVIFIFYYSLLHAASFVDSGLVYRYPIQPFICIFAAYGFCTIYEKVKR